MNHKTERFTINPTELEEPHVEGDMHLEGKIWELHDHHHDLVFWFHTEQEAQKALAFVHQYVQRHGNISFMAFPNSLEEPFDPTSLSRVDSPGARKDL